MTVKALTECMKASGRVSRAALREAFKDNLGILTIDSVHAVAIDWHNVHFLTDELLDTWWNSMSGREKGLVFQLWDQDTIRPANEASLAYDYSCSLIESNCLHAGIESTEWFDSRVVDDGYTGRVADAIEYLEERGLIERDADHPAWISIRDESEATL